MAEALPEYPDSDFSEDDQTPLDVSFNKAADHLRKITSKLNNNQLLELYGLFKQGTEGQCNTSKPGWWSDLRARSKWEAWKALGDMPCDDAKQKYISLVQNYDPDWTELHSEERGAKEAWVAVSSLRYSPEPELVYSKLSLIDAARENLADQVTMLLERNPELKYEKDDDGLTALHWAADRDASNALLAAIRGGCLIDALDNCGQTALHYAASCGHVNATKILVDAGASLLKDNEGNTPLDLATEDNIKKLVEGSKTCFS